MGNKFCVGSPSPKMDWRQLPIASGFWWVLIFSFCHCLQCFFSDKCCVLANSNSKMQVALNLGLLLILGETNHVVLYCCLLAKSKVNRGQHFSSQLLVFSIACVPQKMSLTSFSKSTTTFCELEARSPSESFWKNFQMTPPAARRGTMGNFCTVLYNVARHF